MGVLRYPELNCLVLYIDAVPSSFVSCTSHSSALVWVWELALAEEVCSQLKNSYCSIEKKTIYTCYSGPYIYMIIAILFSVFVSLSLREEHSCIDALFNSLFHLIQRGMSHPYDMDIYSHGIKYITDKWPRRAWPHHVHPKTIYHVALPSCSGAS